MGLTDKFKESSKEEFARVIEWQPEWSTGAPLPKVFSDGHKTYLIYIAIESELQEIKYNDKNEILYKFGLVEFNSGTFRFGIANDEAIGGLPLWGKGLEPYAAHIIENSKWIEEIKNIHKVHPYYNENLWKDEKHFILLFHDELLELIAKDYTIETMTTTFDDIVMKVVSRMKLS